MKHAHAHPPEAWHLTLRAPSWQFSTLQLAAPRQHGVPWYPVDFVRSPCADILTRSADTMLLQTTETTMAKASGFPGKGAWNGLLAFVMKLTSTHFRRWQLQPPLTLAAGQASSPFISSMCISAQESAHTHVGS